VASLRPQLFPQGRESSLFSLAASFDPGPFFSHGLAVSGPFFQAADPSVFPPGPRHMKTLRSRQKSFAGVTCRTRQDPFRMKHVWLTKGPCCHPRPSRVCRSPPGIRAQRGSIGKPIKCIFHSTILLKSHCKFAWVGEMIIFWL